MRSNSTPKQIVSQALDLGTSDHGLEGTMVLGGKRGAGVLGHKNDVPPFIVASEEVQVPLQTNPPGD